MVLNIKLEYIEKIYNLAKESYADLEVGIEMKEEKIGVGMNAELIINGDLERITEFVKEVRLIN